MEKNEFNQLIEQITHGDDKALEAFIAESVNFSAFTCNYSANSISAFAKTY